MSWDRQLSVYASKHQAFSRRPSNPTDRNMARTAATRLNVVAPAVPDTSVFLCTERYAGVARSPPGYPLRLNVRLSGGLTLVSVRNLALGVGLHLLVHRRLGHLPAVRGLDVELHLAQHGFDIGVLPS